MTRVSIHIAAFFAMFFWGISYVWSKVVFEYYTPLTTIFVRLIISFLLLFLFMYFTGSFQKVRQKDIWVFALGALFNPFLYFVGESYGLQRVSASVSAFIVATIPVFTPFLAFAFLRERLSKQNFIGLLISFFGVFFIIFKSDLTPAASPLGVSLLLLAVFSAIIYAIILKKLVANYHPVSIIAWQEVIGALYFLPFFLYRDATSFLRVRPSVNAALSLVMLGVFASALAYVLYTYVLKQLGVNKTNIYINLIPVFATITAFFVLDEVFTPLNIAGMTLVIFGVVLSQMNGLKKKKQKPAG
ncbi:MAG: DMT family transporter [Bacteroidales bacterium]|nr:DMT family transporter [Bacteroidales bacterium]